MNRLVQNGDDGKPTRALQWKCYSAGFQTVYVVAVANLGIGDWGAYIGAQPAGYPSEQEAVLWVTRHGAKVEREVATVMFPAFAEEYEWRN